MVEAFTVSTVDLNGHPTRKFTLAINCFQLEKGPEKKGFNPLWELFSMTYNTIDHFNRKLYSRMLSHVHTRGDYKGAIDDLYLSVPENLKQDQK